MYQNSLTQEQVIKTLLQKIDFILARPGMYVGLEDPIHFYHLISAYIDALAIARSGYSGGFMYGDIRRPDPSKSCEVNIADIKSDVRSILNTPVTMK